MDVMPRIRAKLGDLEVEYEGDEKFIADGLLKFVKEFSAASLDSGDNTAARSVVLPSKQKGGLALSTSSIAQKLGSKTGPELAIAAAAHLMLVKNGGKFSQSEIITEMKEAKTFYKKTYHNNLTNILKTLVSAGRFNHIGGNDYSLSEGEIKDLEGKLA